MTQEDKELLLQDLCERLPYGVKVHFKFEPDKGERFESYGILESINNYSQVEIDSNKLCGQLLSLEYNEVKPYLFPLSSMTEEQRTEVRKITYGSVSIDQNFFYDFDNRSKIYTQYIVDIIVWLNKNHFDYRGLIPIGLANDATGLNIY